MPEGVGGRNQRHHIGKDEKNQLKALISFSIYEVLKWATYYHILQPPSITIFCPVIQDPA